MLPHPATPCHAGNPELREAIAQVHNDTWNAQTHPNATPSFVTANDVMVLAPSEGILLSMMTLCTPGSHIVVTYPGYQSLYQVA